MICKVFLVFFFALVCLQNSLAAQKSAKFTKLNVPTKEKSGNVKSYSYFISSEQANFFQAFISCLQSGMDLVSTTSQSEDEDLGYALGSVAHENDRFWLSGTNLPNPTTEQFFWLTGGNRVVYTNWLAGEPNNQVGNEYCLAWEKLADGTGWDDLSCEAEYRYICQLAE